MAMKKRIISAEWWREEEIEIVMDIKDQKELFMQRKIETRFTRPRKKPEMVMKDLNN